MAAANILSDKENRKISNFRTWHPANLFLMGAVLFCMAARCGAEDFEHLGATGVQAFKEKKYSQAIGYFGQAIQVNTNYVGAYFYRGMSYLAMTQYDSAISDLSHALALNTNNPDAYYFRALGYLNEKQYDNALADINSAISFKTNVLYLVWRANLYLQTTNYNGAIEDDNRIIRRQPWNVDAYLDRARGYQLQNVPGLAMMDCNTALQIKPDSAEAYQERGEVYHAEHDFNDAIDDYDEALRLAPDDTSSYYLKAVTYSDMEDFSNAVANATTFLKSNPEDSDAYGFRGWCRSETGDYAEALSDCQRAVELDPKSMWGYNNLAWLMAVCPDSHFRNGKKALEYAQKACELGGWQEASVVDTLAAAYAENRDFHEAIKYEKEALKNLPKEHLADSYKALHGYEHGRPFREQVKSVNASTPPPAEPRQ
jgi:tetratricopeptide (TPR) repeat protein